VVSLCRVSGRGGRWRMGESLSIVSPVSTLHFQCPDNHQAVTEPVRCPCGSPLQLQRMSRLLTQTVLLHNIWSCSIANITVARPRHLRFPTNPNPTFSHRNTQNCQLPGIRYRIFICPRDAFKDRKTPT